MKYMFRANILGFTGVAVMEPDPMSVVLAVALHGIVGEVALSHFVIGIDYNLKKKNIVKNNGRPHNNPKINEHTGALKLSKQASQKEYNKK